MNSTLSSSFDNATKAKQVCGQGGTFRIRTGAGTPRTIKLGK